MTDPDIERQHRVLTWILISMLILTILEIAALWLIWLAWRGQP